MSTKRATLKNSNYQLFILFIPFILAWFADHGYGFIFKAGVPFSCALIIGFSIGLRFNAGFRQDWYVIAALFFSILGDWFLSFKGDSIVRFTLGIGFYFFAHVGHLGYALATGRPDKQTTLVLLAGYLLFFFLSVVSGN